MSLISLKGPERRHTRTLPALIGCFAVVAASVAAAPLARAASSRPSITVTGKITSVGPYQFLLQTPGAGTGMIAALTTAANTIGKSDWPYVWGGGHVVAGVASIGEPGGSGYNGRRKGFDCSGAVAAVLVAGGLWPAGTSVPSDQGVISELAHGGLISKGAASGPGTVTLWDWPAHHIFMNINGRFWGTSDGGTEANAEGGPGWLGGEPYDLSSGSFKPYHFLAARLDAGSTAGESLGFVYPPSGTAVLAALGDGSHVTVTYRRAGDGTMIATAVAPAASRRSRPPRPSTGGGGL